MLHRQQNFSLKPSTTFTHLTKLVTSTSLRSNDWLMPTASDIKYKDDFIPFVDLHTSLLYSISYLSCNFSKIDIFPYRCFCRSSILDCTLVDSLVFTNDIRILNQHENYDRQHYKIIGYEYIKLYNGCAIRRCL